jgi:hypothetical protein
LIGGGCCKHTALANVRVMSELLHDNGRDDIGIVGLGGINTGKDLFELILCGASVIQIETSLSNENLSYFDRISKELCKIMLSKGYKSINEFKGKIKHYNNKINYKTSSNQSSISISKNNIDDITSYQIYVFSLILLLITIIMFLLEDKYIIIEDNKKNDIN